MKGLRKAHKYEIEDKMLVLHDMMNNHPDALAELIGKFVDSNHKKMDIAGVRQWVEKEAF